MRVIKYFLSSLFDYFQLLHSHLSAASNRRYNVALPAERRLEFGNGNFDLDFTFTDRHSDEGVIPDLGG